MKKVVVFTEDVHKAMCAIVHDSLIDIENMEDSHLKNSVLHELNNLLSYLTDEDEI